LQDIKVQPKKESSVDQQTEEKEDKPNDSTELDKREDKPNDSTELDKKEDKPNDSTELDKGREKITQDELKILDFFPFQPIPNFRPQGPKHHR
jgi:hypothetical protein